MKAVFAILLAGVLVQGCLAAPAPQSTLLNLFGRIIGVVSDATTDILTGELALLNNVFATITPALPRVGPAMLNFTTTMTDLLTTTIVGANDVIQTGRFSGLADALAGVVQRLVNVGNRIFQRRIAFLENVFESFLDGLDGVLVVVENIVKFKASIVQGVIRGVVNTINGILGIFVPKIETCITKLKAVNMTVAVTRMDTYKTSVTSIVNNLNTNVASQLTNYSAYVNTTVTSIGVDATNITAELLLKINNVYTAGAAACLEDKRSLANYIYDIIGEAVGLCVTQSTTKAQAATANIATDSAALQAASTANLDAVCNCVANINSTSTMLLKAQAKTCADTASAQLNSATIQTQADAISNGLATALESAQDDFDQCIDDNIDSQLDPVVDFVKSEIDKCVAPPATP